MRRVLIAGIGNVFLGDDGFGVEVARELALRALPAGVEVRDFGIRGMDLVYALLENHDTVVFIDTAQRGEPPGTLYLIEPSLDDVGEVTIDAHGMDPVKVLGLARALGARPGHTVVVACEPAVLLVGGDDPDVLMELSEPVRGAIGGAVEMVLSLLETVPSAAGGPGVR